MKQDDTPLDKAMRHYAQTVETLAFHTHLRKTGLADNRAAAWHETRGARAVIRAAFGVGEKQLNAAAAAAARRYADGIRESKCHGWDQAPTVREVMARK